MLDAPKGLRLHIGLFGRRNVGKSSLLNALAAQSVSIVSDTPGTTVGIRPAGASRFSGYGGIGR